MALYATPRSYPEEENNHVKRVVIPMKSDAEMNASSTPTDARDPLRVATLYKFAPLDGLEALQAHLIQVGEAAAVKGTLLIAPEGVNGTLAGPRGGLERFLAEIRALPGFEDIEHKESLAEVAPFARLRVRIKREIVTIHEPLADPNKAVGTYVDPSDWNALIADPNVVVIDTRNDYEIEIGSFERAIDPGTTSFGQFPAWVRENLNVEKQPKVAMFCTGGIRCEKASALLKNIGFKDVYHLKGGILKYLEEVPAADSKWHGECFVFDGRVSLKHGLERGSHAMCESCNHAYPQEADRCPHCGSEKRFGEC